MNKRCVLAAVLFICMVFLSAGACAAPDVEFVLPSGVRVQIVERPFAEGHFKMSGCLKVNQACLINGHVPFGSDLDLPKTYVKRITASYQGHSYSLDASDMYDAWGRRPLEFKGGIRYFGGGCADPKSCGFRGIFSDGAGTYVAEWRVVNGVSVRTVLTDSNDVVSLFMTQIDPPDFE